jgi:multidrug efflux pump subunit AcrA (membrane-fusion protein)
MKGLIVLALLGCVAYVGYIVLPSAPERPAEAPAATSVSVVHPLRKDLASVIEVTGSLMASQEVQVHSLVAGYVKEIRVDIGDHVQSGDLIATLEVINLEGQLRAAKDANRGLGPSDMGAGQGATATPETATPEAATLVTSPGAAAPKVSNTSIFAPFSGVITQRNVDTGTLVQTGVYSSTQSLPLVTLAQDDLLRASFPVPETALGKFRIGEEIEIDIPVLKRKITGKIARSSNQIASATRTMDVEVDIPNPDLSLTLGLYAIAAFPLERAQGALSLPVQAIRTPDDPSVLVISGAGLLEQRPVKLGVETPSLVQVVSGVSDTDLVVLGNASELEPGMKVAPFESQDPAAPSPAAK